ncbi:MAG: Elongation factor G [Planctomycetes bacterium]|nr:Elongation factor G [Planctomycetota bacterium]
MDPKLHASQVAEMAQRRNFGIMAHIDAGKTTVSERILYFTGRIRQVKEVHDGGATMDYMQEERERGITITSAATTCKWRDKNLILIDTPGHVDFTAEVERSLRVLDGAVTVFDGVAGVEAQTETVWRQAERYGVPRICYVNKLDRAGADFQMCVDAIRTRLGAKPVPLQLPIVVDKEIRGIIDLIEMDMMRFTDEGDMERLPIPDEHKANAEKRRNEMIEAVADYSDALLETYLEGGHVSRDEIRLAIRKGTLCRGMYPVLCGAALRNKGVQPLLDAVCDYLPSPLDLAPVKGTKGPKKPEEEVRPHDENAPFCGIAFKTVSDPNGDLTFVRVYSGVLNRGDEVFNTGKSKYERIGRILRMHANQREPLDKVKAGDICAVIGLKQTYTGDTLCTPDHPILLEAMNFPDAVISQSVEPKNRGERDKLSEALSRLSKEDPTFRRFTDPETDETIIAGMGELHLEIIASRLNREFKVEVITGRPRVAYRQTFAKTGEIEGRHVKQSGGSGQYGIVKVIFEPVPGSTEVEFLDEIKGGAIPREFIPAIEDGIRTLCEEGGELKIPIVGFKARLVDGKYHDVDSSEMAFKAAGQLAVREAIAGLGMTILEPLMKLEVTVPDEFMGAVLGDLNSRRTAIEDMASGAGTLRIVRGKVPIAEMFQYSTTLRSLTQGRGTFSMEPSAYQAVPRSLQETILKEARERRAQQRKA